MAECWSECVRKEITIPIKHIITFDECGDFESRETTVIGKECEREENEIEVRLLEYDNTDVTETSSPVSCNTVTNTPSRIVIFKSTLANNISKVLGNSTMLQNFDFHHLEYKNKSHNSSRLTCAGMLPQLQEKVKEEAYQCKAFVSKREESFFTLHAQDPTNEDIKNDVVCLENYKKLLIAKKLLKTWNLKM